MEINYMIMIIIETKMANLTKFHQNCQRQQADFD